jgi:hypothetical protein
MRNGGGPVRDHFVGHAPERRAPPGDGDTHFAGIEQVVIVLAS